MSNEHGGSDHVSLYLTVFGALMVLTVVTVLVSHFHLPRAAALTIGLAIATLKASLVAAYFMHLKWERALIYGLLGMTVFFSILLFAVPILDGSSNADLTIAADASPAAEEAHH